MCLNVLQIKGLMNCNVEQSTPQEKRNGSARYVQIHFCFLPYWQHSGLASNLHTYPEWHPSEKIFGRKQLIKWHLTNY